MIVRKVPKPFNEKVKYFFMITNKYFKIRIKSILVTTTFFENLQNSISLKIKKTGV